MLDLIVTGLHFWRVTGVVWVDNLGTQTTFDFRQFVLISGIATIKLVEIFIIIYETIHLWTIILFIIGILFVPLFKPIIWSFFKQGIRKLSRSFENLSRRFLWLGLRRSRSLYWNWYLLNTLFIPLIFVNINHLYLRVIVHLLSIPHILDSSCISIWFHQIMIDSWPFFRLLSCLSCFLFFNPLNLFNFADLLFEKFDTLL